MSRARPKRVLENVPEDDEAGWAPGAAFAEGGLHIPFGDPSTSTQEAENHRRQSVAALQKAGNVRSRLAAFEANLRLEPVEEVEVRKSWRPTWKKPKKDDPEAAASPRNPITKSFAALRKSAPDSPAALALSDAQTPLRSSTGNLTPRAKEASPFLKTVQGFLALRRSTGSGLSVSSEASPKEQDSSPSDAFSPLGSGLSTTTANTKASGPATQTIVGVASSAGAAAVLEPAQADASGQLPAPASAGKAGLGPEGSLAARLACEAAIKARKNVAAHAAAAAGQPFEARSPAGSPQPPTAGRRPEAALPTVQAPLVMTVGAAEPVAKRKGPRSPVIAKGSRNRLEAADEGTPACSAGATPAQAASAATGPVLSALTDAQQAGATPTMAHGRDDIGADHTASSGSHDGVVMPPVCEGLGDREVAEMPAAAAATSPPPDQSGSTAVPARMPLAQLDIPDSQGASPEGSASGQQVSPLLTSIKKLVSQQAAVSSEGSLSVASSAVESNAGESAGSLGETGCLPAPTLSDSPTPTPHGPHSKRGNLLEADDVSDAITSPILGSSELRTAVAAAQARVMTGLKADHSMKQPAAEHSGLSQPPDTSAEQASLAPAKEQSAEEQAEGRNLTPSDSQSNASATLVRDLLNPGDGSLAADDQPRQTLAEESETFALEDTAAVTVEGKDAGLGEPASSGDSHPATLERRPSVLSIVVDSSKHPARPGSASGSSAKHGSAAASPFHTLASPIRALEGSQSPDLHASMSPGTPAAITLQPMESPNLPCTAMPVGSPSMQNAPTSSVSPAATETEGAFTPASQPADGPARQTAPTDMLAHIGSLNAQLQKLDSGDLDDASSATETASIADSEITSEVALCSTGGDPECPQAAPLLDIQRAHITPEQCHIRRSFRTPERELQHPMGNPLSPPQRAALDGGPFTAAAALMLRSPGARHSPLSPRSRLSPRSVPPLPHSRLFAVSPRSSSSPELDSPLEEAVEELISATCNLEDVQVLPSTSEKAGSPEGLVSCEADCPTPLSRLQAVPADHSVPMPVGSPASAGMFGQRLQPLAPFPMGESPALGSRYTAPQNTPAACPTSGLMGSARHVSMMLSPHQAADSAEFARLLREESAMGISVPARAPGVQDLLAAFRRAAGQERAPPASTAPAQPDSPESLAASPGPAAPQADQIASGSPEPEVLQVSSTEKATWRAGHVQEGLVGGAQPIAKEQAGTAAEEAHILQNNQGGKPFFASGEDVSDSNTASDPGTSEAVPDTTSAPAEVLPVQEALKEAASSPVAPVQQAAQGLTAAKTAEDALPLLNRPAATSQEESDACPVTLLDNASLAAAEAAAATPETSQGMNPQQMDPQEGIELATVQKKSPNKASREGHSANKAVKASRPQRLHLEDAENVSTPPASPGHPGSGGPVAALSPSKLSQKLGSPGNQMRSPLTQRQAQPLSPAQELSDQSAGMGEVKHLHAASPGPIEVSKGSCTGTQLATTPATAPRAANPAAFLRNTNSIYSPDVPADAGTLNGQAEPHSPVPEQAKDSVEGLDAKFNLQQFSPRAARRLSTGQTPPLPAAMARSGSQPPSSKRLAETPQEQPGERHLRVTFDMQSPSQGETKAAQEEPHTADLPTPVRGDEHYVEPESPVFDESFALDAQLILGSLVTPATAARPPAQRQPGPTEEEAAQQAEPEAAGPSRRACEIVEEAAAEAGLIKEDTARLVKVMGHFLDALMGELSESKAQRSLLDLAAQELRQKCEVLVDENRQLRKDLQEQETEMFKVREDQANTEQQFKTLYRSKYLPLKEEVQECRQDIARLKACRAADAEACEKWRSQVATQQLQIRKADTEAEVNIMKIRSLQANLQATTAAAAKAAALQQEADRAALQAAEKASKLEDQLHVAKAEQEVLVTQSEEASARVAAAQAARDRAVKEGYAKEEESFSVKKRLQEFKRENDKFADIKAQLKGQVAQLQDSLAKKEEENQNLLAACEQLVSEREAARSESISATG